MPTTAAGNSQAVQNPATIKSQIQCQLPDFLPSTNYGTCIVNVWANGWAVSNFVTGQIYFLAVKDFSSKSKTITIFDKQALFRLSDKLNDSAR